ncbi:hypothetical protein COOONC_10218 [Cooperia oncophora]
MAQLLSDSSKGEILAAEFEKVYVKRCAPESFTSLHDSITPMDDSVSFTRYTILEQISKWSSGSSYTPDGIPFVFIKKTAASLSTPLEFLYNLMKEAPFCDPNNYRSVSITSICCSSKKFSKGVIVHHLETKQILSRHQHGFKLEALNDWTAVLDVRNNLDVIYFDFQKAFDKVIHPILLQKLVQVGIHERIIKWIKNS